VNGGYAPPDMAIGVERRRQSVSVNGLDVRYFESGAGPQLILLHGGSATNDPVWDDLRWGWSAYIDDLARSFHVFAPDIRGHGATRNPAGTLTYDLLADDLMAFIAALGLEKPAVIGFSEGGIIATVVTIRDPIVLRAVVNIAGYDLFDPISPSMERLRRFLSRNDPTAKEPDLIHIEERGGPWFDALIGSHDAMQGSGAWRKLLVDAFDHWTAPIGYGLEDLRRVSTPTLIMAGDRDPFCGPEVSIGAFRLVPDAELAIIPNCVHAIVPEMVSAAKRFLTA